MNKTKNNKMKGKSKVKGGDFVGYNADGTVSLPATADSPAITVNPNNFNDPNMRKLDATQRRIFMRLESDRRAQANLKPGERVGYGSKTADISEPQKQSDGTYLFPKFWSGKEISAFQNENYYKNWDEQYMKGKMDAKVKFQDDADIAKLSEKDLMPNKMIPETQRTKLNIFDLTNKYGYEPYNYGYNEQLTHLMVNRGMTQWENEYADGYNDAIKEYSEDAEKLYDEAKYIPDTPNTDTFLKNHWKIAGDGKYSFNARTYGHNAALKKMFEVIPRPKKKDWTDYFVQGLTMPFALASQIPGLNEIPGIKQTSDILGGLQGGFI